MKLELSINVEYLRSWDLWAGTRELVQNGVDAEVQYGATLKIDHHNDTLRIENDGCLLPREALLLGTTTKSNNSSMIGSFGEGLKLGCLALVRAGHSVKIRSGSEVWVPTIERSEKYDADVLVFNIKDGGAAKHRVRIEIGNVPVFAWKEMKEKFLFLDDANKKDRIKTNSGELLTAARYKNKVFVKGIYVQTLSELEYGYNFTDAEVDRDRRMVHSWDVKYKTAAIWVEAVNKQPELLDEIVRLAEKNIKDVHGLDGVTIPVSLSAKAAAAFRSRHGDNAVPVSNLSESKELEHLGARGVVTSAPYKEILKEAIGSQEEISKRLREEVLKVYSWSDLTPEQQFNLDGAMALTSKADKDCNLTLVDVVDFRDPDLNGQCKNGRIFLSIRLLAELEEVLATAVHEFSHHISNKGDGDHGHVCAMRNMWRDIVKFLRSGDSNAN